MVVCVQDSLSNPDLLRLIDRGASLKPLILTDDLLLAPHLVGAGKSSSQKDSGEVQKRRETSVAAQRDVSKQEDDSEDVGAESTTTLGTDEIGLGQTPAAEGREDEGKRPNQVVQQQQQGHASPAEAASNRPQTETVAEQAEVRALVNRLQRLTDYSASLIHVYIVAPGFVFLNPKMYEGLKAYKRLLAQAFPARASLASLASVGPRILRHYMANKRAGQSNQPVVTMEGGK